MGYNIVVVGATGNVGHEMLNILAERQFPVDKIAALASRRSLGTDVSFGDKTLKTKDLDTFDFTGWDMALFAVGSEATKKYAPKAAKAGCVVIDNSSLYRYDPEMPLIVPEVNPKRSMAMPRRTSSRTRTARPRRWLWRSSRCTTARRSSGLLSAPISRCRVRARKAIDELWDQTKSIYNPTDNKPPSSSPSRSRST